MCWRSYSEWYISERVQADLNINLYVANTNVKSAHISKADSAKIRTECRKWRNIKGENECDMRCSVKINCLSCRILWSKSFLVLFVFVFYFCVSIWFCLYFVFTFTSRWIICEQTLFFKYYYPVAEFINSYRLSTVVSTQSERC